VLKRKKKPHTYVRIQDAGAEFVDIRHRVRILTEVEKFLATHLGRPSVAGAAH